MICRIPALCRTPLSTFMRAQLGHGLTPACCTGLPISEVVQATTCTSPKSTFWSSQEFDDALWGCRCTPGEWTLSAHETTDLTVTQLAREIVREKIFRYTQQVSFLAHK